MLAGICQICGKPTQMPKTCMLCGKNVCINCFDLARNICKQCGSGRHLLK